jgi:hypothetical protein
MIRIISPGRDDRNKSPMHSFTSCLVRCVWSTKAFCFLGSCSHRFTAGRIRPVCGPVAGPPGCCFQTGDGPPAFAKLRHGRQGPWLHKARLGGFVLGAQNVEHPTRLRETRPGNSHRELGATAGRHSTSNAEHMNSRADLFCIMKREHDIRPARAREDSMRNNLSVLCVKPI